MTAAQVIPLVILVVMFIVATKWPLNIGVTGLVASFGVDYFMLGMTDSRSHRPAVRTTGQRQDTATPLGVLPPACRPNSTGHLLPRCRRAAGTGRRRIRLRIPHPSRTNGGVHDQRRPRRRLFPVVRGLSPGPRRRSGKRLLPSSKAHSSPPVCPQSRPLRTDHHAVPQRRPPRPADPHAQPERHPIGQLAL